MTGKKAMEMANTMSDWEGWTTSGGEKFEDGKVSCVILSGRVCDILSANSRRNRNTDDGFSSQWHISISSFIICNKRTTLIQDADN